MSEEGNSKVQDPNESIKPRLDPNQVPKLVARLYGIQTGDIKSLPSYDDLNFFFRPATDHVDNKNIPELNKAGYVLKFGPYLVRLLTYIPGSTFVQTPYVPGSFYNIGKTVGKLHNAIADGFNHPFYENHRFLWSLTEMTQLREFLFAVKDANDLDVVTKVVGAFERDIVPRYPEFTPGVIHGDINAYNTIVFEVSGQEMMPCDQRAHDVTALIDWSDVTKSYFVFDIAIAIAYFSIDCEENKLLDVGGHILKGYTKYRKLNEAEIKSIPLLVCSRLCQTLVFGAHTYTQQPGNEYVLATAKKGWPLLHKYWSADESKLLNKWKMSEEGNSKVQDPNESIKPRLDPSQVPKLVARLYGIQTGDIKSLPSYDDLNFFFRPATDHVDNKNIPELNKAGYVLKFGPYLVRLLTYIPGSTFVQTPYVPGSFYNIGKTVGKLHNAIADGFNHPFYENHRFLWSLTEMTRLREFFSAIKDANDLDVVTKVVDGFERDIVPRYPEFTTGVIHGDINEQNTIVSEVSGQEMVPCDQRVHDVTALLDWSDVTKSYFVFDIAITIAYCSIECEENKQLDVGGHILKGYTKNRKLNEAEFKSIPLLVCSRLCQSLVLGAHAYSQQPGNEYLLTTAKKGWPLLHKYWSADESKLLNNWKAIIEFN
ncbi:HYKK-like protein [Mya arenaria]|uniref:Hydroxylysine kinase n=1 Tax=Mya arenaria TaxID=6604 RepID=A0ABY7FMD5_MYAAR|nr:HYKK-like protein [Mya arenaria]